MASSPVDQKTLIKKALNDEKLRKAVENATITAVASRREIVDAVPYWEDLRRKLHDLEKEVIDHLKDKTLLLRSIPGFWMGSGPDFRRNLVALQTGRGLLG